MEKRMEFAVICLTFFITMASTQSDFRKGIKCKDIDARTYGRTSDRDLYGPELKLDQLESNQKKTYAPLNKPNFYDPNYGFSREALASLDLSPGKEVAAESISNGDIKLPENLYQRNIYSKYPDLRNNFRTLLQTDNYQDSQTKLNPGYPNPLSYLNSYVEKTKPEDTGRAPNFGFNDYEKYLRDSYNNPIDYSALNYGKFNSEEENIPDTPKYNWQAGKESYPRINYQYNKNTLVDDGKYLKELLEQSKAILSKINSENAQSESGEDFDGYKFRDNERPSRKRRPNQRSKRPRRGPAPSTGKNCPGGRCNGSIIRIPRFTPF